MVCSSKGECDKGLSLSTKNKHDLIIEDVGHKHGETFKCAVTWKSTMIEEKSVVEEYSTDIIILGKQHIQILTNCCFSQESHASNLLLFLLCLNGMKENVY